MTNNGLSKEPCGMTIVDIYEDNVFPRKYRLNYDLVLGNCTDFPITDLSFLCNYL